MISTASLVRELAGHVQTRAYEAREDARRGLRAARGFTDPFLLECVRSSTRLMTLWALAEENRATLLRLRARGAIDTGELCACGHRWHPPFRCLALDGDGCVFCDCDGAPGGDA
jgi:hypothetical protein